MLTQVLKWFIQDRLSQHLMCNRVGKAVDQVLRDTFRARVFGRSEQPHLVRIFRRSQVSPSGLSLAICFVQDANRRATWSYHLEPKTFTCLLISNELFFQIIIVFKSRIVCGDWLENILQLSNYCVRGSSSSRSSAIPRVTATMHHRSRCSSAPQSSPRSIRSWMS